MKSFTLPRLDAANHAMFLRTRAAEAVRPGADKVAPPRVDFDRDRAVRDRIHRPDANASFWILHAR